MYVDTYIVYNLLLAIIHTSYTKLCFGHIPVSLVKLQAHICMHGIVDEVLDWIQSLLTS